MTASQRCWLATTFLWVHHQLSNRLAFTWKLAEMGIPVVLCFTGDGGIRDAVWGDANWQEEVFEQYAGGVGAMSLFERRHELGGAPFWMLSRSRRVLQASPPKNS